MRSEEFLVEEGTMSPLCIKSLTWCKNRIIIGREQGLIRDLLVGGGRG